MQNELQISQRGIDMPASPIRKLAPLAYKAEDEGVKIYRLNIGQPDLPTPQKALDALKQVDRQTLEYSPSQGYRSLRNALVNYYERYQIKLSADDIIEYYGLQKQAKVNAFVSLNFDEKKIVDLLADGEKDFDYLAEKSKISVNILNSCLTTLEIRGLIRRLPAHCYSLIGK